MGIVYVNYRVLGVGMGLATPYLLSASGRGPGSLYIEQLMQSGDRGGEGRGACVSVNKCECERERECPIPLESSTLFGLIEINPAGFLRTWGTLIRLLSLSFTI